MFFRTSAAADFDQSAKGRVQERVTQYLPPSPPRSSLISNLASVDVKQHGQGHPHRHGCTILLERGEKGPSPSGQTNTGTVSKVALWGTPETQRREYNYGSLDTILN